MTLQQQLEKLNDKYTTYYKINRKHIKYANVKQTLEIMREQIAMLESRIMRGES